MNTNGLAKQYDKLTPWERVPMMVAASCRGDAAEAERLARSSPTSLFRGADYRGLSERIGALAGLETTLQPNLARRFWPASGSFRRLAEIPKKEEDKRNQSHLWQIMR